MKYVATSFGSAGDFLPTLAIAKALHAAGHEITFVTNPFHERQVRAAGLAYVGSGALVDVFKEVETNPVYMDAMRGGKALWNDIGVPFVRATHATTRELLKDWRPDAALASNLSFGTLWAAAEREVPTVIVSATPLSWIRRDAPMPFIDAGLPHWLTPWLGGLTRSTLMFFFDRWLRALAKELGSTARDPSMSGVERDCALNLGMWPSLIRGMMEGDAPNMRVCGFARGGHLGGSHADLPEEVELFLSAGTPPVVVGLGSAFPYLAGPLLLEVAEVCEELGRRCLIIGHPSDRSAFPGDSLAVKYAPYHLVFPRAAASVIHGGAGTTGEALRSGRPCVVLPIGFDQFALSWQVERLGAGVRVAKSGRSKRTLKEAIARAISDPQMAQRAIQVANILSADPDGAEVAARHIEGLGARG